MECTKQVRPYQDPYSCKHKDQENLALEVTDENVHDDKILTKLVIQVLDGSVTTITPTSNTKSNKKVIKIKSALVDGVYDYNTNFQYLQEKGITSGIKVRTLSFLLEISS